MLTKTSKQFTHCWIFPKTRGWTEGVTPNACTPSPIYPKGWSPTWLRPDLTLAPSRGWDLSLRWDGGGLRGWFGGQIEHVPLTQGPSNGKGPRGALPDCLITQELPIYPLFLGFYLPDRGSHLMARSANVSSWCHRPVSAGIPLGPIQFHLPQHWTNSYFELGKQYKDVQLIQRGSLILFHTIINNNLYILQHL